jgi:hypothetical protein
MGCHHSVPLNVTTSIESYIHTQAEPYIGLAAGAKTPSSYNSSTKLVVNDLSGSSCQPTLRNAKYDIFLLNGLESTNGIQIIGQKVNNKHQMILQDNRGNPIAICMLKPGFGLRYNIYAFHPIQAGQKATTQKYGNRSLYQWAECSKRWASSSDYKLKIWNGVEYTKRYLVESIKPLPGHDKLLVRSFGIPACLLEQTKSNYGSESWNATLAPGIDPCLMVYLIAIIINLNKYHRNNNTSGGGCGGCGGCGG